MSCRRIRDVGVVVVTVLALGLYVLTAATTVTLVDSGELILCAYTLDIPHPPGFPTYILSGWLFSRLNLGSPALRLNIYSGVMAAVTVGLLAL